MFIIFNIFIVGFVLLIAYWWANQGVFSAILHLLCVITAGAIALAFWEPLTAGVMLRGGRFDNYAWGMSLILVFAVSLLVLRLAMDRLIPGNVDLPHWANLTFGFPIGLASGILTIGILVIGAGFVQATTEIAGYKGWARSTQRGAVQAPTRSMWMPVHQWTVGFYEQLSVGALATSRPLRQLYPQLDRQAMSLIRDSYRDGRGQISLAPQAAEINTVIVDAQSNRHAVELRFTAKSRDFGEQLTISQAQVRLINAPRGRAARPTVVYPDRWIYEGVEYRFDSVTHYATSTPGQESAVIRFMFPVPDGEVPRYIQIKGMRYRLPEAQPGDLGAAAPTTQAPPTAPLPSGGGAIDSAITLNNTIRPVVASKNMLPGTLSEREGLLTEGEGTFGRGGPRPSKTLAITGYYEPPGTRIVKVDVSVGGPADIFGSLRAQSPPGARIALIDSQGRTYSPMGYMHRQPEGRTTIRLEPRNYVATLEELPSLPSSGTETLILIFTVTEGSVITGLRFGDVMVGTCNVPVEPRRS